MVSSRVLASLTSLVLAAALTACTGDGSTDPDAEPKSGATSAVGAGSTHGPVQDVWIYERVQAVTAEGLVDVTKKLLAGVDPDPALTVELVDGVTFTPVPELRAQIRDDDEGFRDDLDVVAGVLKTEDGTGLQVVATPRGDTSVEADDELVFDMSGLELAPGTPLIADFAFGQGIPAAADDAKADGLDLLRERMAGDRFHWLAEDMEGELSPGLLRVFGSVPEAPATGATTSAAEPGAFQAETALATGLATGPGKTVPVRANGGGGGIPLKAKPAIEPLGKLGCFGSPLKCLSKFFKKMKKGVKKVMGELFEDNIGPDPRPTPRPCDGCGGSAGEPHLRSFDGTKFDVQLAGEFVAAKSEGFEVQLRFVPQGSSDQLSVTGAVAIAVGDHRVTMRSGRDPLIMVDGEALTLDQARAGVDLDGATVSMYADDLQVTVPDGPRVEMKRIKRGSMDVWVDPGPGTATWSGLFGNSNGNPADDFTTPDGTVIELPQKLEDSEVPHRFAGDWRITDEESLFDYGPGENTGTFTDLEHPRKPSSLDLLPADRRAVAELLCAEAGIVDPFWKRACIFDYGWTGDVGFVHSAQLSNAGLDTPAQGWTQQVAVEGAAAPMQLDGAGHVLVPGLVPDGQGLLTALDLKSGDPAWELATDRSGCVVVTESGQVVASVPGAEGKGIELAVLNPADGKETTRIPVAGQECTKMAVSGDIVLVRDGDWLRGIDIATSKTTFELELKRFAAGPVVSDDGTVWLVRRDGDPFTVVHLDPAQGKPVAIDLGEGEHATGNLAATADGVVFGVVAAQSLTSLLRVNADGVLWRRTFPVTLDGTEVGGPPVGPLEVSDTQITGYVTGQLLGVFDLADGTLLQGIDHSSFNNNNDAHLLAGSVVVVGPFGADVWVEAWPTDGSAMLWSAQAPEVKGVNDVKWFGPVTPSGQVMVGSNSDEGLVVAKVGPGTG